MQIKTKVHNKGITVVHKNKYYSLLYPEKIWISFPKEIKNVLTDNLIYLLTVNFPLIYGSNKLFYDTSLPLFKSIFSNMVLRGIPGAVEKYKQDTGEAIKEFLNINYEFKDLDVKKANYDPQTSERAAIPLSFGKDSLISTGVCNEIGLNPVCVYINDTVSPRENKLKIDFMKKFSKEQRLTGHIVLNELEKLNDFETWNKDETCLGYTHMVPSFSLITLPIACFHNSKYIVIGCEKTLNDKFLNKNGFWSYPAFDQIRESVIEQNFMVNTLTNNKVSVISVVEPLEDIAIMKILHNRYPDFAKYQISCNSLDASSEKRWCHSCSTCINSFLHMIANGFDPKKVGFHKNLLDKKYKRFYSLFNGKDIDVYDFVKDAKEEQLLAFYLAFKNGYREGLMKLFKKRFLNQAVENEDKLRKKYFKVYDAKIPNKIKKKVFSIYKEEIKP